MCSGSWVDYKFIERGNAEELFDGPSDVRKLLRS